MKLHLFRLKEREEDGYIQIGNSLDDKYPLYAFTDDKHIADRFMCERRMDKFIYITTKKPADMCEMWMHQHRGNWLSIRKVETYINKNTENQYVKWAEILATENEISYLEEAVQTSPIDIISRYVRDWYDPQIFTSTIQKALSVLKYDTLYNIYDDEKINAYEDCYYYNQEVEFDNLGMFTLIYHNIISDQFYNNIRTVDKD